MSVNFSKLRAPFAPDEIEWRVGSTNRDKTKGLALAYMDARAVMDRFDIVCGPANWQCRYTHAGDKTVCEIGVRIDGDWIWKADGAGDTQFEAHKGALSDAFKRAAFRWGVGRYLYDLPARWVEIEERGRTAVIKDKELDGLRKSLPKIEILPTGPRNKTKAKEEMQAFLGLVHDDEQTPDEHTLDAHIRDHTDLINQVMRDWPEWWNGIPGNLDFVGAEDRVRARRDVLRQRDAEGIRPEAAE